MSHFIPPLPRKRAIKLSLIGATGRLGSIVGALAIDEPEIELVSALTRPNSPHLGLDYGAYLKRPPIGIPISDRLEQASLILDLSLGSALEENLKKALFHKAPIVIGTTGLKEADFSLIKEASLQIPIFYSPNFSFGMALLHHLASFLASYFPKGSAIDLIEAHRKEKKDAPSGSALSLCKLIKKHLPGQEIKVQSIRSQDIIGEHELHFTSSLEKISIKHEAHSREAFAQGALLAAKFLFSQPPGLYGMDDLIGLC